MRNQSIADLSRKKCCGCEACRQICPAECITFAEDSEGFVYPNVDMSKCVKCGKCVRVCPCLDESPSNIPTVNYAFWDKRDSIRNKSSSGGFFTFLAERVLSQDGVVFGAGFNHANEVVHTWVEKDFSLDGIRRSKYVQSRIGDSFKCCRDFLRKGRQVLFVGTPCQIKALNLFVSGEKNRSALTTVDFICHGVPSPGVFRSYLNGLAQDLGTQVDRLESINFRDKRLGPTYSFSFSFSFSGTTHCENMRSNHYLIGFLKNLYLRPSCYDCPARGFSNGADYTMCDYWGLIRQHPDFPADTPWVSRVFIHRDKLNILDALKTNPDVLWKVYSLQSKKDFPAWSFNSVPKPKNRDVFFRRYRKDDFKTIVADLSKEPYLKRLRRGIRHWLKMRLVKIGVIDK